MALLSSVCGESSKRQVMSPAQLHLSQVLSKPDSLHASRLLRPTEEGAAGASGTSWEKACEEETLAVRERLLNWEMDGREFYYPCLSPCCCLGNP